jgi:hypothetical protein
MNPDVVRPGTSDALTARTIDATIYPPLVRAQETAATLVPRLAQAAAPLFSPLLLGALLLTLVFSWIAIRMRYRPSGLLLGALLVVSLTSFNPAPKPEAAAVAGVEIPRTRIGGMRSTHHHMVYTSAPAMESPAVDVTPDPVQVYLPSDFAERLPEWSRDAMRSAERMMRENERMREVMKEIRYRLREEARRRQRLNLARQMNSEGGARLF